MYKLVLVDDEDWILSGIQLGIDWEELGFVVAGTYSNGRDALTAMLENPPDALLTDIKMPILDGISLVRELREAGHHDLDVVVLSGYDEFEYAQSSLRLGAVDYVLKPAAPEQIMEVFVKIKQRLDAKRGEELERQQAEELAEIGLDIFEKAVFDAIRYGNDAMYDRLMSMNADFLARSKGKRFVVVSAALKNTVEENQPCEKDAADIKYLKKKAGELQEELGTHLHVIENRFACSLVFMNLSLEDVDEYVKNLQRSFRKETGSELLTAKSDCYTYFQMMKTAYESSFGRLFCLDMPASTQRLYRNLCNDTVLKAALADRDQQIILWSLKNWSVQIDKVEPEFRMRLMKRLAYSLGIYFINHGMSPEIVDRLYEPFKEGASYDTTKESIISLVKSEFFKGTVGGGRNANLCKEVAKYISSNYSDDITLNELADRFYISPNYLGTLFKKNMGIGVKEYQTNIRLEQADILIATGRFKLYQVAEMVGYPNYEYFRKTYCKYRGKNPSE